MKNDLPVSGLSLADFDAKSSRLKVITKTYSAGMGDPFCLYLSYKEAIVSGNFSVPTLCFVLARRSGFCFLQLFVPATAVVISSWISLWLDNETQFTDIVSVILAIIFLSYSYNTVMPKVSYVKVSIFMSTKATPGQVKLYHFRLWTYTCWPASYSSFAHWSKYEN